MKIATSIMDNDGKVNQDAAMSAFFDRRMSDENTYRYSWNSLILCSHDDFPRLRNYRTFRFYSGKNALNGYYYECADPKGLILYVHGIGGNAFDWYSIGQNEWLRRGYNVFAIELTASGYSQGLGIPGLHQSALDVAAAVNFIKSNRELSGFPLFLFGHSWGGYGVSASLHFVSNVNAVAELSGFSTPLEEMIALPEAKLQGLSLGDSKPIEDALSARGGQYCNLSAVEAIKTSSVPVFAAHGGMDSTVPYKESSILNQVSNMANVTPMYLSDNDHVNIFLSKLACAYRAKAMDETSKWQQQYGRNLLKVDPSVRNQLASRIDRNACSEVNSLLFDAIDEFYQANR